MAMDSNLLVGVMGFPKQTDEPKNWYQNRHYDFQNEGVASAHYAGFFFIIIVHG
jgi:hypothetical protein